MFKTILLAYDGSDHAKRAARIAKMEAEAHGARLVVVHVYEPVPDYLGEPFFQEALKRRLERAEKVLVEAVGLTGVPREDALLLEGRPAEAILEAAIGEQADLIVMGTRGLGAIGSLFMGSQSQKVLAEAPCPVLLVR
ncbi:MULTISPECIES: universal stress protein [Thermus]|jgi:nucleotide-binding universal stress UspA family protein|uniref:Universal stress protein n=1 Tax=Thermus brockianus TaxID=56956 RepID=A0A1J0LRY8_THEBO|nr:MULTISPECIES: universal stress protein [Thermus]APD08239.1 universal stress protein [Thermus brockianus]BDG16424.1 universal stress protein [Thermus brockianus]